MKKKSGDYLDTLLTICRAYDCMINIKQTEDLNFTPSKTTFKESGQREMICELLGHDKENSYYDSLVIVDDDSYGECEYAVSTSDHSREDAFKKLLRMISGATLRFTDSEKTYAKIPKFKTLSQLKMKLAIEGANV